MRTRLTAFLIPLVLFSSSLYMTSYALQTLKYSAASIAAPTPSKKGQADGLYQEGNQLFRKYRWRLALEKYKQSLWLYQEIDDKAAIANTLIQLGLTDNFLKPLKLSKVGNPVYVTQAIETRKEILEKLELKDEENGREFFQQALKIRQEVGDRAGEAVALIKLGETYEGRKTIASNGYPVSYGISEAAEPEKAAKLYKQAISIYQQLGDKAKQRDIVIKLGNFFAEKQGEDSAKAVAAFEQALAIYPDNRQKKLETLVKLAEPSERTLQGRPCSTAQRMKYCRQALELYRVLRDKTGEQVSLRAIILASPELSGLGKLKIASSKVDVIFQESLKQAKALYQINADKNAARAVLHELAWVYYPAPLDRSTADKEKIKVYSRLDALREHAVSLYQESGDQKGVAETLLKFVKVHLDQGIPYQDFPTEPLQKKALELYQQLGATEGKARTLYQMGVVAGSCRGAKPGMAAFGACNPVQALNILQKPLVLYRQLGDRSGEAQVLLEMALNYEKVGANKQDIGVEQITYSDPAKAQQALELYQQALAIYRAIDDKTGELKALFKVAATHQNLGRIDLAKTFYRQALILADGDEKLEFDVACTAGSAASAEFDDFLDLNGDLSLGDQYLHAQRDWPGGPEGRGSGLRGR